MLNVRLTGTALLAAALLAACGSTPSRESTGEYIDDTAITTKVKAALVADKSVKATNVSVETFKGTVQLSGFADNTTEIARAVEIASKVAGVKAVQNDIKLKAPERSP
ncbi:MAG: BON domain-containing protein [Rhodocyclales bacterium]|nr:BON domain-containing protein [Rhodocyclales bacterium]